MSEEIKRSKNWLKIAGVFSLMLLILVSATLLAGYSWFNKKLDQVSVTAEDELFVVPSGATIKEVSELLEERGIIESALIFRLFMKLEYRGASIKAGEFMFEPPVTIRSAALKLVEGRVYYHRVTVPEGLDWQETAEILSGQGFGSAEEFLDLIDSPQMVRDLDPEAANLEGYLFPETYFVTHDTSPGKIIELMVDRFRLNWTEEFQKQALSLDMSIREVITLASLIEKETSLEAERPLVSSVFHNRLAKGMKLACDPTVIYAVKLVKPWDGVINRSDLQLDSPYNTYIYPGLPPGPIANPGIDSIRAALFPEKSDFLFFVSRNDGSHVFSENYSDHAVAVRMYQR